MATCPTARKCASVSGAGSTSNNDREKAHGAEGRLRPRRAEGARRQERQGQGRRGSKANGGSSSEEDPPRSRSTEGGGGKTVPAEGAVGRGLRSGQEARAKARRAAEGAGRTGRAPGACAAESPVSAGGPSPSAGAVPVPQRDGSPEAGESGHQHAGWRCDHGHAVLRQSRRRAHAHRGSEADHSASEKGDRGL